MKDVPDDTLEKSIRDSAETLLTSGLTVKVLDSWKAAEKRQFLELYRTSQWHKMYEMMAPVAGGMSVRTVNALCDMIAEVLEEQEKNNRL